jgi:hypothetical protein
MFYCDQCAKENGWPRSSSRWNSVCEVCDVLSECNDIPSCALPDQKRQERHNDIGERG